MYKILLTLVAFFCFFGCKQVNATTKGETMAKQTVVIRTNLGDIEVALDAAKAPETVENFLSYVDAKHYNGTVFHRVIDGFMIQGGGYTSDFSEKKCKAPIRNEADNRLENKRGTIAMARTSDVHSATAQFFINVSDNDFLNFRNPTPSGYGYCVFGEVTKGMDIVDQIRKVKTGSMKGHQDVPLQSVSIVEVIRND
jgi:peptidyl-prolyl cis-trans isomerase B (cyclophilin B)